ncbi:MAG: emopamil-binding family protein [Puia sp.]|nr:emopamil-binding family protein [Puia sp.]
MQPSPLPLSKRPVDIALILFFCVNLFFITYIVDLEQLVIPDAAHFQYPVWPPAKMVDLVHWYGHRFDPVLIARPAWWRATIWIDALFFGPFYIFAIYAYAKGRNWIRFASIVWASVMLTNVSIILFEEVCGEHASPQLARVFLSNAAWVIFPVGVLYRMWRSVYPFSCPSKDVHQPDESQTVR